MVDRSGEVSVETLKLRVTEQPTFNAVNQIFRLRVEKPRDSYNSL